MQESLWIVFGHDFKSNAVSWIRVKKFRMNAVLFFHVSDFLVVSVIDLRLSDFFAVIPEKALEIARPKRPSQFVQLLFALRPFFALLLAALRSFR